MKVIYFFLIFTVQFLRWRIRWMQFTVNNFLLNISYVSVVVTKTFAVKMFSLNLFPWKFFFISISNMLPKWKRCLKFTVCSKVLDFLSKVEETWNCHFAINEKLEWIHSNFWEKANLLFLDRIRPFFIEQFLLKWEIFIPE